MAGFPPGQQAQLSPVDYPPGQQAQLSPVDHLRMAIEHAQAALTAEPSDADSQTLARVIQGLYQILAQRQKEDEQVLGNPGLLRSLQRYA